MTDQQRDVRSPPADTTNDPMAVFRDPALDAALRRDGHVLIDLAEPDELTGLTSVFEENPSGIGTGYYASFSSEDRAHKTTVDQAVCDVAWPFFGPRLINYEPLLGVFMIKHPGPDTEVKPHQDWMMVEEAARPSINAWFPLTPITRDVGRMAMLTGSHLWLDGLRGSPAFPTRHDAEGVVERVRDELMTPMECEIGQALVYDTRILHGTPPNLSDATRVVGYVNAMPAESPMIHWHRHDGGFDKYHVERSFFTTYVIGTTPEGRIVEHRDEYDLAPWEFEEFVARANGDTRTTGSTASGPLRRLTQRLRRPRN